MRKASLAGFISAAPFFAAALLATSAHAQTVDTLPVGSRPRPASISRPSASPATPTPAPSRRTRPGSAFLPAWSGVYLHSELDPERHRRRPRRRLLCRHAAPLSLRDLRRPRRPARCVRRTRSPFRDEQKFALALGARVHPNIALGISLRTCGQSRPGRARRPRHARPRALARAPRAGSPPASSSTTSPRPRCRASRCNGVWEPESPSARSPRPSSRSPAARASASVAATSIRTSASGSRPVARRLRSSATSSGSATSTSTASTRTTSASRSASRSISSTSASSGFGLFGTDPACARAHGYHRRRRSPTFCLPGDLVTPREHLERVELAGARRARAHAAGLRLRAIARDQQREVAGVIFVFDGATAAGPRSRSCATRCSRCARPRRVFAYMVSGHRPRLLRRVAPPTRSIHDPAGGLRLVGIAGDVVVLPRPVRHPRRTRRVREDRRVQERAGAVHRDRADRARARRCTRPSSRLWAPPGVHGIAQARHVDAPPRAARSIAGPTPRASSQRTPSSSTARHGDEVEQRHRRAPRPTTRHASAALDSPERDDAGAPRRSP